MYTSVAGVIEIIEHIESQLSNLKKALKETKPIVKGKKEDSGLSKNTNFVVSC